MTKLKRDLTKLKKQDIYSIILFCLFKMKAMPKYATLSELVYILDKDSLLKLCEYFGGMTITIPTIDELESLIYALLLYQKVNIEKQDLNEVLQTINFKTHNIKDIKEDYLKLTEILNEYEFPSR